MYLALFLRPEKDHPTQLYALSELLRSHPELKTPLDGVSSGVQLVLIGGSRNEEDTARVDSLRSLAKQLDVEVRC